MDTTELRQLIAKPEWADIELKAAANSYPKEALSTVSAFANTGGGYLIFGIDERQPNPIVGVKQVDKVQSEFIGLLKDLKKFSHAIRFNENLVELDGKYIIIFKIEEALKHEKPIYLNRDMKQTYLRKGGRDDKASDEEIKRLVRDASLESLDERLLGLDPETCFDANTIKWYRKVYESRNNHKYYELSNLEFLDQFALIKEDGDDLKPTLGAILMFGADKYLRQILPRFTMDAFWHKHDIEQSGDASRWDDRRSYESNLFNTWQQLSERFMYYAEQPFEIDQANLQRSHETPDYIGFREAAINTLIHQDYSDSSRIATVHFYRDASVYFNPGDSLVDESKLGKGESATRNPLIMQTFHRIGLSDRAGSGLKDIYKNWQKLDRPKPEILNDKARKTFQITLGKKQLVSDLQEQILQRIGVKLTHLQAQVLSSCIVEPHSVEEIALSLDLAASDIFPVVDYLSRQALIAAVSDGYQVPEHFIPVLRDLRVGAEQAPEKVTNQSDQPQNKVTNLDVTDVKLEEQLKSLTDKQKVLIQRFEGQLSLKELMDKLGQSHRTHFKNKQLQPLIDKNLVAMTHPETPHHQEQAYYLTGLGVEIRKLIK